MLLFFKKEVRASVFFLCRKKQKTFSPLFRGLHMTLSRRVSGYALASLLASALIGGCAMLSGAQTATVKALSSPYGQLFCQVNTTTGPAVLGVADAAASGLGGAAGLVAVFATNATAAAVQADCRLAAAAVGGTAGIPVVPPAVPVGNVAIIPVASTLVSASAK